MSEWTEEEKLWIWRSGVILDEGMVSDLVSGVLWPEPCRRWVSELKRRSCESEDLVWFWMKEWSLISGQVFSDLNPVEDEWVNWREEAVNLKGLEWFWMKEWSLISCQVFSDLNPVEDEWGELKRRSCESKGSGVILDEEMVSDLGSGVLWPEPCRRWVSELKRRSCESEDLEWFWMKEWSMISCQVFSNLIRYYRRKCRAVILQTNGGLWQTSDGPGHVLAWAGGPCACYRILVNDGVVCD